MFISHQFKVQLGEVCNREINPPCIDTFYVYELDLICLHWVYIYNLQPDDDAVYTIVLGIPTEKSHESTYFE